MTVIPAKAGTQTEDVIDCFASVNNVCKNLLKSVL